MSNSTISPQNHRKQAEYKVNLEPEIEKYNTVPKLNDTTRVSTDNSFPTNSPPIKERFIKTIKDFFRSIARGIVGTAKVVFFPFICLIKIITILYKLIVSLFSKNKQQDTTSLKTEVLEQSLVEDSDLQHAKVRVLVPNCSSITNSEETLDQRLAEEKEKEKTEKLIKTNYMYFFKSIDDNNFRITNFISIIEHLKKPFEEEFASRLTEYSKTPEVTTDNLINIFKTQIIPLAQNRLDLLDRLTCLYAKDASDREQLINGIKLCEAALKRLIDKKNTSRNSSNTL